MKTEIEKIREQINAISEQLNKLEAKPRSEVKDLSKLKTFIMGKSEALRYIMPRCEVAKEVKPEYEVGVWYKSKSFFVRPTDLSGPTDAKVHGFKEGEWFEYPNFNMNGYQKLVPATEIEIKDMLEKEAVKRGIKDGVKINRDLFTPVQLAEVYVRGSEFHYDKENDKLLIGERAVYRQGIWATVVAVKEAKIEIGGYEVKFFKCGCLTYTSIDGFTFTKEFWQAAKLISSHGKAKIMIGCSKQFDVSLETINLILAKL